MKDKIQEEGKHKGSAIFLKKICFGTQWPKIRLERGKVLVISMPGRKRFWNAVLACVLLRKNFWNSVPSQKCPSIRESNNHNEDEISDSHGVEVLTDLKNVDQLLRDYTT
jgi:hypothetical protein